MWLSLATPGWLESPSSDSDARMMIVTKTVNFTVAATELRKVTEG